MTSHKELRIIISLGITVIFFGIGLFLMHTDNTHQNNTLPNSSDTPSTTTQSYLNSVYGFSIRYPSNWHIGLETGLFYKETDLLDLSFCPTSLFTADKTRKQLCAYTQTAPYTATFKAPIIFFVRDAHADVPQPDEHTTVIHDGKYQYVIYLNDSSYIDTYHQIVSSFDILN